METQIRNALSAQTTQCQVSIAICELLMHLLLFNIYIRHTSNMTRLRWARDSLCWVSRWNLRTLLISRNKIYKSHNFNYILFVCVCVYVYVCACACVYMCMLCMCMYTCTCMYMYICMCMCTCVYVCACVYMYVSICVFVWYVHVYVCMCVCETSVCVCVCVSLYQCVKSIHVYAYIQFACAHTSAMMCLHA